MTRWSMEEMYRLARSGAVKVDLLGQRGATRVTCDEVSAMAAVLLISGALPEPGQPIPEILPHRREIS